MSFKNLFQSLWKNESEIELETKLKLLEMKVNSLKGELKEMQEKANCKAPEQKYEPPIIIEKINIEKIILDKYELNNNFGQLGIKELKGKLNIGATYGSEFIPSQEEESEKEVCDAKIRKQREGKGPNINIKAKREE